jgi:hypothetical protein
MRSEKSLLRPAANRLSDVEESIESGRPRDATVMDEGLCEEI